MAASLITKVVADIHELEAGLKKAEALWRKYEETARKAASLTLTGGTLSGGGGGGAASAAAQQKSDLKLKEEELKASLKRQQAELAAALKENGALQSDARKRDLQAEQANQKARLEAVKAAFTEERELRRQDAADARRIAQQNAREGTREARLAAQAAREVVREDVRGRKGSEQFQAARDKETRAEIRAFQQIRAAELALEKEADQAGERAFKEAQQAKRRELAETRRQAQKALREQAAEERETARAATEARRAEAGLLRGNIRQVVGTGAGAGPPFRPIPTGSRPEDIRALRQHLAEAEGVGARLSRTLRRIGEEDLRTASQSAHFFANALKLAAGSAILGGFAAIVREGINLNREWERFRFGLGTALALTSKVVDAQGNLVNGARAFRVFAADGEKLFKGIRTEANKTILTTEELTEVVTTNFANALRAGIPEKEIINLTSRIAQVAKSVGLQGGTPQLVQEVRAILQGDTLRGATVAQILGLTPKGIKDAKESGTLLKLLNDRLAGAKPLVDAFGKSSEAAFTTLQAKAQDFLRFSLEDVFKRLTGRVLNFNEALSDDKIKQFASTTGKVLSDLFRPIESFLDSGRGEKLAETFAKAFEAVGAFANSSAFDSILKLFNYMVDNHVAILEVLGGFQLFKGANAVNTTISNLGRPGGLLAGTSLGSRVAGGVPGLLGREAAELGGGAAAGAAGARSITGLRAAGATFGALGLRGTIASLFTAGGTGLGAAAGGAASLGGLLAVPALLAGGTLAARDLAETNLGLQRAALTREPGARSPQRLGIARQALQDVERQAREATERGEFVPIERKFPVALGGDQERTIQLSLASARKRVEVEQGLQAKLAAEVKTGGDHRVANEQAVNKQILDLGRIQGVLRTAQLQGDVRRQIELETALNIASAQVDEQGNKKFFKNEQERQAAIQAAREEGGRKLRELDRKALLDTAKLDAEAAQNRRRQRRVDLQRDLDDVQERVRTRAISPAQGGQQAADLRQKARNEDLRELRETRDRASEIEDAFSKLTIRATREQRKAREDLAAYERQVARQARDLAKERIDAERSVTEAIVQQARTREDVGLRRATRGQREAAEAAIAGSAVGLRIQNRFDRQFARAVEVPLEGQYPSAADFRSPGVDTGIRKVVDRAAANTFTTKFIRELASAVLTSGAVTPNEVEKVVKEELQKADISLPRTSIRGLTRQLASINVAGATSGLQGENIQRGREAEELGLAPGLTGAEESELIALQLQAGAGNQSGALRLRELERKRTVSTKGAAQFGADQGVRSSQEALARAAEQEVDARREAAKQLADLRSGVAETRISLEKDFLGLGKQARDLQPDLKAFGDELGKLKNVVGEIAKLTPEGAATRAAAIGPKQVNLTVDLRGGLGEGTVTDPIVQVVLDKVLQRLQHDLKRGPVGAAR